MSAATMEARRREVRRKKILENMDGRLRKALHQEESPEEEKHPVVVKPEETFFQPQLSAEIPPFLSPEIPPFNEKIIKEEEKVAFSLINSHPVLLWTVLGLLVRLCLSNPSISFFIMDNALVPFATFFATFFLANFTHLEKEGKVTMGSNILDLVLKMSGVPASVVDKFSFCRIFFSQISAQFSLYFFGFLVCHLFLWAAATI